MCRFEDSATLAMVLDPVFQYRCKNNAAKRDPPSPEKRHTPRCMKEGIPHTYTYSRCSPPLGGPRTINLILFPFAFSPLLYSSQFTMRSLHIAPEAHAANLLARNHLQESAVGLLCCSIRWAWSETLPTQNAPPPKRSRTKITKNTTKTHIYTCATGNV